MVRPASLCLAPHAGLRAWRQGSIVRCLQQPLTRAKAPRRAFLSSLDHIALAPSRDPELPVRESLKRALPPRRRFDPAVPGDHPRGLRGCSALDRPRPLDRGAVPALVVEAGHVHPPVRVDELARDARLARASVPRSRRHADRRDDLGQLRAGRLPAGSCRGHARAAASRRLVDLGRERQAMGRLSVAGDSLEMSAPVTA